MRRDRLMLFRPRHTASLVIAGVLAAAGSAYSSHSSPPPPPPPGHGQLLVRLIRPAGEQGRLPEGQVRVEAIELHRVGAPAAEWVRLPLIRTEFSPQELLGGPVWVADVPLPAGEYDQIRASAGGRSALPLVLRLMEQRWFILSLEVGFQTGPTPPGLRLTLKRAQTEGPY